MYAGLPLRRDLHRPRGPHRRQVQLLRPSGRRGAGAGVRGCLSDAFDLGRRPEGSDQGIARLVKATRWRSARRSRTRPEVFYMGADRRRSTRWPLATRRPYPWARPRGTAGSPPRPSHRPGQRARTTLISSASSAAPWGWRVTPYFGRRRSVPGPLLAMLAHLIPPVDLGLAGPGCPRRRSGSRGRSASPGSCSSGT